MKLLVAGLMVLGADIRQKPLNLHFPNYKICSGIGLSFLLILHLHATHLTFKPQGHLFSETRFDLQCIHLKSNHFLWNWCGTICIWSVPWMISNYIHHKVWDEITYPCLNFFWGWINKFRARRLFFPQLGIRTTIKQYGLVRNRNLLGHNDNILYFYPRPVLAFGYCRCLRLSVCVSVCVRQPLACPRDNSWPVSARITKFGP